jgi:hypothetical protein
MASARYYRVEAARCRELAAQSPDADMAKRWRSLAADYDTLAEALEASPELPAQSAPMQQQPMQQQQVKTKNEDDA